MQFKKIAAMAGSALMAGMTLAGAGLAATNVGNIAELAKPSDSVANFPLIVVGKTASTEDVAGAINIAVRLAAESKTTETVSTAAAAVDGVERDGIAIGTSSTANLYTAITGGAAFPNSAIIKNAHYSTLKDSTFSWKSNDYDYREEVNLQGVAMRHDLGTDKINGTEKMEVQSGDIIYKFVFEKALNMSTSTSDATCTIADPEYTDPVKITMLGKAFTIVGVGSTSIKMLAGESGTAKKQGDTLTGITSGDYTVYVTGGANNDWASFEIKDADGNVVDTLSGIAEGNSKDSSATSLTVKVTDVRVSGTDPSTMIIETDVVVGPTGTTEHEYDSTADVDATGAANEAFSSDAPRWGIQYSVSGGSNCYIPNGAEIQVVYKPSETEYYKAGTKVDLPNDYGSLGFEGWNTDKFATITVKPYGSTSVYFQGNASSFSTYASELYGLEVSSDTSGVIVSPANNYFTKAYVLFNKTRDGNWPVAIGYPNTAGKILVNDSWATASANTSFTNVDYGYALLDATGAGGLEFNYTFKINAGEADYYLNVRIGSGNATIINTVRAGDAADDTVIMNFTNKSVWTATAAPQFRLGTSTTTAETSELGITTESTAYEAGKKTGEELVDDSGILVLNPSSNGASDQVKIKVPSKTLAVKVYFGKKGEAATETTTEKVVAVTADVAKLDTEVSTPTGSDMILVGGPCVNTLVASLAADGKFDYTCDTWPAENMAIVKVVEDAFETGKVAVVVAGTRAADTDLAARAIQAGKLDDQTATSVTLKGETLETMTVE